jgi:hypothetical protein
MWRKPDEIVSVGTVAVAQDHKVGRGAL